MLYNNCEINVLVKGRPITEFYHNGQTFLEGRGGSNFEIEFRNRNNFRVEAVISVDGLSVIDGKEAGPQSAGYLVEANGSVTIPGWKLTDEQVAAFVFAGKGNSYATTMTGSSRNNGVIGALVYKEKGYYQQPVYRGYTQAYPFSATSTAGNPQWALPQNVSLSLTGDALGGAALGTAASIMNMSVGASSATLSSAEPKVMAASVSRSLKKGMAQADAQASLEAIPQNLGTGFGQAQDFKTETVNFQRGDLHAMLVLFYDDAKGLKARGIQIVRPSKQKYQSQPNAFPGMNCAPPPGWNGGK